MIAFKEFKVCHHGLNQNVEALRGLTVKLYQDNMMHGKPTKLST
jgi:hypothetical protein